MFADMQTLSNQSGRVTKTVEAAAASTLVIAFVVLMWAGLQQNAMLRDTHYVPVTYCQNDPAPFRLADMKIERCVPAETVARWNACARVKQLGWPFGALLFGESLITQRKRQRRLTEANVR